jgi:glycosyltransferase involved in cell wall biosynthesis
LGLGEKFVVTYVGAHGIANHLIQLIDVAENFQNTNVVFQFIGAGMQKTTLIEEVQKRNLKNVIFRNPVPKEEVFKYILASDIGASVLKRVDTFKTIYSNKTFDYMSCKKPILLAIDGISRKLIEEANCGIYSEPENKVAISNAIEQFCQMDEKELRKLGENGFLYAKKNFDRDTLSIKYYNLMKSII